MLLFVLYFFTTKIGGQTPKIEPKIEQTQPDLCCSASLDWLYTDCFGADEGSNRLFIVVHTLSEWFAGFHLRWCSFAPRSIYSKSWAFPRRWSNFSSLPLGLFWWSWNFLLPHLARLPSEVSCSLHHFSWSFQCHNDPSACPLDHRTAKIKCKIHTL